MCSPWRGWLLLWFPVTYLPSPGAANRFRLVDGWTPGLRLVIRTVTELSGTSAGDGEGDSSNTHISDDSDGNGDGDGDD